MIDWQPIETAPRDGKDVLVYADQATVPLVALVWWYSAEIAAELGTPEDVGWWSFYSSCVSEKLPWEPTHWAVWEPPSQ